jgi:chromosome segregation ATPase
MKKVLFIAAVGVALLVSCNGNKSNSNEANSEIDSLQNLVNEKDLAINEMMGALNEIQTGFKEINEAEGRVNMLSQSAEGNSNVENIRETMTFIQETMESQRQKIAELEKKFNASNLNSAKLKEAINGLKLQLEEKSQAIETLTAQLAEKEVQITTLNEHVEALTAENSAVKQQHEETKQVAQKQDAELNTAWYVFGTSKELKEQNILQKGEVLQGNYNKEYFTKIDIRTTRVIPLNSKSAKILTTHPADSYKLMKDSKGEYTLCISENESFWSISKYLVILVK